MAITVNGRDGNPFDQNSVESMQGRFIKTFLRLTLSGSTVTGGDALDFTNGNVNSALPPLARGIEGIVLKEHAASYTSFLGSGGYFALIGVPGAIGAVGVTALNAWKMVAYSAGGTAQTTGLYSGLTGGSALPDVIEAEVTWFR